VAPVAALSQTNIVGIEQDPARAAHTRARFPQVTILTADLGTVRLATVCFSRALKLGLTNSQSYDKTCLELVLPIYQYYEVI